MCGNKSFNFILKRTKFPIKMSVFSVKVTIVKKLSDASTYKTFVISITCYSVIIIRKVSFVKTVTEFFMIPMNDI